MAALLTAQRQQVIKEWLARDGRVLASSLATMFEVSEDTIRRDLRELAAAGHCKRVYGGALPFAPDVGQLAERILVNPGAKEMMARKIVGLIVPGSTIFIDAGSTNVAVARLLPDSSGLTVVTNSPAIAHTLEGRPGISTIMLGGRLDAASGACTGPQVIRDAERIRPSVLLLGACGVDIDAGVTAYNLDEAELKGSLAAKASEVFVAATLDKIGTAASFAVIPMRRVSTLVVENGCPPDALAAFREAGTHVLEASPAFA